MKKIALLLAVFMLLSILAGCGDDRLANDETYEPTESIPVEGEFDHTHTNGEHVYVTEEIATADCTNPGKILHICVVCGEGFEEIVDAYGHEVDTATCEEPGRCMNCNMIVEEPLGHYVKDGICERCRAVID